MAPVIPVYDVGRQGFKASAQGLGCMGMSAFYKDVDHQATEEESIAIIHKAIDLGVTLLDTSDMYGRQDCDMLAFHLCNASVYVTEVTVTMFAAGPFTNEELVGELLCWLSLHSFECSWQHLQHELGMLANGRFWTAGRAIKGKRSQVQLCTKFAIKFTKEGGMAVDGSRKYVRHVLLIVP